MTKTTHLCTLKPVGKTIVQNRETVLQISPQYMQALKKLSHFSHIIMFSHNTNRIRHYICKAYLIDEKNGTTIRDLCHTFPGPAQPDRQYSC